MTKDEALRLALEALELANYKVADYCNGYTIEEVDEAITAIKAALEANEFNPDWDTQAVLVEEIQRMAKRIEELEAKGDAVAWMWMPTGEVTTDPDKADGMWEPLFITPPQRTWVGLTDEDISNIWHNCKPYYDEDDFARAIEAKLKEKNT